MVIITLILQWQTLQQNNPQCSHTEKEETTRLSLFNLLWALPHFTSALCRKENTDQHHRTRGRLAKTQGKHPYCSTESPRASS